MTPTLHADAVASAVVRGESAVPLLAILPAGTGGSTSHAVQRERGDEPAGHSAFSPPEYVQKYLSQTRDAIADRLRSVGLDAPHPRLGWIDQAGAIAAITAAIWSYVRAVPEQALKRLMMLAQPADLYAIVDHVRREAGGVGWQPQVGQAIAVAFDEPLVRERTVDRTDITILMAARVLWQARRPVQSPRPSRTGQRRKPRQRHGAASSDAAASRADRAAGFCAS